MSDSLSSPRHSPPGPIGSAVAIPQQVTDPTILDSVAGFINDVVPTANTGFLDPKFQILWVHFEQVDSITSSLDVENEKPPPIVLSLGYSTGVQVWAIAANGEGREILSWRHGSVKVLKFLPKPCKIGKKNDSDPYETKRPLVAICDSSSSNPQFSSIIISSLKTGEQVKVIKFKNTIIDVKANKAAVVVVFHEKIAVFDALTFEDRLTVTTCYLSLGFQPNPTALGSRWLAYADKKLNVTRKSSGGNEGEGVQSYTATVLHAAKSLKKGLRELGESVASSLTGAASFKPGTSPNSPQSGGISDESQKGIITILDIENPAAVTAEKHTDPEIPDPVVAHFVAHTDAIAYLHFDYTGMLLFTADKRGHDFNIFRINAHVMGSLMASVHHLYILHRGDTTARVQDMCFSPDSRWAAVSTLRGTTHVFPISPYGGNVDVRTHATPHVVNKLSRFHKSAGLTADGRSNSPVSMFDNQLSCGIFENSSNVPKPPVVINALAQLRQPVYTQSVGGNSPRQAGGRQRLSSSEEIFLRLGACFAPPRTWRLSGTIGMFSRPKPAPAESLYTISSNGILVQYDLDPHHPSNVTKEKVCKYDTPIELTVHAKAQWMLTRQAGTEDIMPPMSTENLKYINESSERKETKPYSYDDQWLSEVEITTHAGPHRRLWMGPQFTFKTYTTASGSLAEAQPLDLNRSKPVNMPTSLSDPTVYIESGSASSSERQFLEDMYKLNSGMGELRLKEDLADAMMESPGIRETGGRCVIVQMKPAVAKVVNPLGTVVNVQSDGDDNEIEPIEEEVIHENCDEALFRPFVATKTVAYQNKVSHYGDNIITKSLEGTTEVTVRVLKKSSSHESSSTKLEPVKENQCTSKSLQRSNTVDTKTGSVGDPNLSESGSVSSTYHKTNSHFMDEVDYVETPFSGRGKGIVFNIPPPLDNDDFFSLETISKIDNFEDAVDCGDSSLTDSKKEKRFSKKDVLYNEDVFNEEKTVARKSRKPTSKLGVKIANAHIKNEAFDDCSDGISFSTPPKRSWSSVAASKRSENLIVISDENEKAESSVDFDEEFTVTLPRKVCQTTTDLIDINTPQEDLSNKEKLINYLYTRDGSNIRKIDKSSDDLKAESGSSQTEVTESDDSGKVLDISNKEKLIKYLYTRDGSNILKIDKSSDDEKAESSSSQTEVTESDDSGKVLDISVFEQMRESKTVTLPKSSRKKKKRK